MGYPCPTPVVLSLAAVPAHSTAPEPVDDVSGIAQFDNLSMTKRGGKQFGGHGGHVTDKAPIPIRPASANKMVIAVQLPTRRLRVALASQPVSVADTYGNVVPNSTDFPSPPAERGRHAEGDQRTINCGRRAWPLLQSEHHHATGGIFLTFASSVARPIPPHNVKPGAAALLAMQTPPPARHQRGGSL